MSHCRGTHYLQSVYAHSFFFILAVLNTYLLSLWKLSPFLSLLPSPSFTPLHISTQSGGISFWPSFCWVKQTKLCCSLLYSTDWPLLCSYIFIALSITLDSSFPSTGDQNYTHHYKQVLTHTCSEALRLSRGSSYKQFKTGEPHILWCDGHLLKCMEWGYKSLNRELHLTAQRNKTLPLPTSCRGDARPREMQQMSGGQWAGELTLSLFICLSEVGEGILGLSTRASCPAHFLFCR